MLQNTAAVALRRCDGVAGRASGDFRSANFSGATCPIGHLNGTPQEVWSTAVSAHEAVLVTPMAHFHTAQGAVDAVECTCMRAVPPCCLDKP